ncbi:MULTISPECIES: LysR family transcriptional regulator [Lactobacillus]|uniref:LysR family transcriptional regulator n=1 Tax=Lactobacillus xujianguonis TaxID=2495899 RepID=A0A437SU11_9LACO|nr:MULTISPECIES: LysR family transcriptional regulator [Lactobacillus]RVU70342.1 LysR family transcriptional regulator [Lactobacillus xujianguonis]RVU76885.1 LysR family transcriptional regulator [Lactobacillus xujianguonis]
MNLRHLEFFMVLAKTEHMAKAAEELGISQPSLSYAINNLEEELGVPLFEKDGRNIKLTNYGKIYLKYVKEGLGELNKGSEYIAELLNVNKGHINLGFTFTMGQNIVPEIVRQFLKDPQHNQVTFSFKQGTTDELVHDLLDDKLDIVFSSEPRNLKNNNQINLTHIVNQEIMAAVPPHHPLGKQNGDSVTLKQLLQYPLIAYSEQSGLRPTIEDIITNEGLNPNVRIEAIEDHTIIGFVHWNFGVAIIPHLPQLAQDQVELLHLDVKKNYHRLFAITKNNHFMTSSMSLFFDFVCKYCKENYLDKNILI